MSSKQIRMNPISYFTVGWLDGLVSAGSKAPLTPNVPRIDLGFADFGNQKYGYCSISRIGIL
jgi:hypothetical protein